MCGSHVRVMMGVPAPRNDAPHVTTTALTPQAARVARSKLVADAFAGHDVPTLLRRGIAALGSAVPFDAAGFCATDPDTLLWTDGVVVGLPAETVPAFFEAEVLEDDVLAFRDLAGARRPVGVLSVVTDGAPERSARFRRMYRPNGMADELRVALMADGRCYGAACLLRAEGGPRFTAREATFMAEAGRHLGDGLRAALTAAPPAAPDAALACAAGPAVVVVDDHARPLSVSDAAAAWLERLDPLAAAAGVMPPVVQGVVASARRRAAGEDGPPPRARLRTAGGCWVTLHATALSGDERAWAVVLEPSRPSEVLPLIAEGHDLTGREREVLALLLRGVPDRAIAEALVVSPHTAREHARRVLQKFGVRSRGELQALLFEQQHAPWAQLADAGCSSSR